MKIKACLVAGVLLTALSACGGGSSGGGGTTPPPVTPPPVTPLPDPHIDISLSSESQTVTVNEGATEHTITVLATSTTTGSVIAPVIVDVQYDTEIFASVEAVAGTVAGTYTLTARTQPDILGGNHNSVIHFRLCHQTECTKVYAGSTKTFTLDLTVNLAEWTTFQRNNQHTGYVHVRLDPTKFAKAWDWTYPHETARWIGPSVSSRGHVYFSAGTNLIVALEEDSGKEIWSRDLQKGGGRHLEYPGHATVSDGMLYVPAQILNMTNSFTGEAYVREFNALDGVAIADYPFSKQSLMSSGPVVKDKSMFIYEGYYGDYIYKYDLSEKKKLWEVKSQVTDISRSTVSVDNDYIYTLTNSGVSVYDSNSGAHIRNSGVITGASSIHSELSAPVVVVSGSVLYRDYTPLGEYYLVYANVLTDKVHWKIKGSASYQPVVSKNSVYMYGVNYAHVDAYSLKDGSLLWQWKIPAFEKSGVTYNLIATENVLFFSNDQAVYAIDAQTGKQLWSHPVGGNISISSNYMLYISNGYGEKPKFVAIKLR